MTAKHEGQSAEEDIFIIEGFHEDIQFPIQRIQLREQQSNAVIRKSVTGSVGSQKKEPICFSRVIVEGDDACDLMIPTEAKHGAQLITALNIRRHYMSRSLQSECRTTTRLLQEYKNQTTDVGKNGKALFVQVEEEEEEEEENEEEELEPGLQATNSNEDFEEDTLSSSVTTFKTETSVDPWTIRHATPTRKGYFIKCVQGVFKVFSNEENYNKRKEIQYNIPTWEEFVEDKKMIGSVVQNGPLNTYCHHRLSFLSSKFQMHLLLNDVKESASQKMVPHRDFYNIHKVDTHIHAASCMNHKHLLRFIKKTLKRCGDETVTMENGIPMTLNDVFQSMRLTPYDLCVDVLDVHADRNTFHRFDKFNAKYNPIGESRLREVFLKTDNHVNGKYFAEIIKEVITEIDETKYQKAELRLSIYGKNKEEWDRLAQWAVTNDMYSENICWLVQLPRLYDVFFANKILKTFQEYLENIFSPLFEVTNDNTKHPVLHKFLSHVVAFDSVDDESKPESLIDETQAKPDRWNIGKNPSYAYYLYYTYANIAVLNHLRKEQGLNTFAFRPHCGEVGSIQHLICGFMVAHNISHGLQLRKSPTIQYLYYLAQIGIAMSPVGNNSLFLQYHRNPLPDFLARGLFVSLSTDDPLQFHYTREPLMEEYSIAAQVWKLTPCDMCELARNSVLMSGFSNIRKKSWIGSNYRKEGVEGNDVSKTNVPNIRVAFRHETLVGELTNAVSAAISFFNSNSGLL